MIKKTYGTIDLKPRQSLYLHCLGDVGFGGVRCDEATLRSDLRYLLWKKKNGNKVRMVGLGDWGALPSPSERGELVAVKKGHGLYDSTLKIIDDKIQSICEDFVKEMTGFEGDFLGTVHGHHLHCFSKESALFPMNSDQFMCEKLHCDYYGDIGFIKLNFPSLNLDYKILVHHGYGSGRTDGSAVSKRERAFKGFDVDMVIMGHDNRRMANSTNMILYKGWKEQKSVGSGAYERAYRDRQFHNGYVEELLLNPSAIGGSTILFENWENRLRVRAMV